MHDTPARGEQRQHRWAYNGDLDDFDIEWHERDLGPAAAVMVVVGETVLIQIDRRALDSPQARLLRPWVRRHLARGWEFAVAWKSDLAALAS